MCISINLKCIMWVFSPCQWTTCSSHFTRKWPTFLPSSWAVVKAEGRPSSSMTEQLLFGSHMVPTSAIPSVSQVVAPQRSWWHRHVKVLTVESLSLYSYGKLEESDRTRAVLQTCFVRLCRELQNEQTMKSTNTKHMGLWFAYCYSVLKIYRGRGSGDIAHPRFPLGV